MAGFQLNTNIPAMRAARSLSDTTSALSKTYARLSSGLRINSASDDAAGLAVAAGLTADSVVFTQGVRNVNDGISLLNIADSSLESLSNILVRQQELASQAANGTLRGRQRIALDNEAQALAKEWSRIIQTTEFNGQQIFSSSFGQLSIQAGMSQLQSSLGGVVGNGTLAAMSTFGFVADDIAVADFNGDGIQDIAGVSQFGNEARLMLGRGDGTFGAYTAFSVGGGSQPLEIVAGDFNGDGKSDLATANYGSGSVSLLLGRGDGTFQTYATFSTGGGSMPRQVSVGDFNSDGIQDVAATCYATGRMAVLLGQSNGTLASAITTSAMTDPQVAAVADYNNDGIQDFAVSNTSGNTVDVLLGYGDGRFNLDNSYAVGAGAGVAGITAGDFNGDNNQDFVTADYSSGRVSVYLGRGDGTFTGGVSYSTGTGTKPSHVAAGDFNGDGRLDVIAADFDNGTFRVLLGAGDGTFGAATSFSTGVGTTPNQTIVSDLNNDGVQDVVTNHGAMLGNVTTGTSALMPFSIRTRSDALSAMTYFKGVQSRLSTQRATIGAMQSRLGVAASTLGTVALESAHAASRITDADIAEEAAQLVRQRILQQAGAAVLAQANMAPQKALALLQ